MSILEWNEEIELEKLRRSERAGAKAKGLAEGRAEGESQFALLATLLLEASRIDDLKKAASDPEFRAALYKQYDLIPFEPESE